jgi:hypothetical protein
MFGNIRIFYSDNKSISGKQIKIRCSPFLNPIQPVKWEGFKIISYDYERLPKPIEVSEVLSLDATKFKSAVIEDNEDGSKNMIISPYKALIGARSKWSIFVKIPVPLELGCFVKLQLPKDLNFEFKRIQT